MARERNEERVNTPPKSGIRDFDFLVGTWTVANRRLKERLVDSTEWDEFAGTAVAQRFFDGAGSFDTIDFPTRSSTGMSLRLFNPERNEWTIYWADDRSGILQPPVVGHFIDGHGEFYGDDEHDGTPVRVRYIWSGMTDQSASWEQAFSVDGEATWETNWIMNLRRDES
jgi:hypothetical protein